MLVHCWILYIKKKASEFQLNWCKICISGFTGSSWASAPCSHSDCNYVFNGQVSSKIHQWCLMSPVHSLSQPLLPPTSSSKYCKSLVTLSVTVTCVRMTIKWSVTVINVGSSYAFCTWIKPAIGKGWWLQSFLPWQHLSITPAQITYCIAAVLRTEKAPHDCVCGQPSSMSTVSSAWHIYRAKVHIWLSDGGGSSS